MRKIRSEKSEGGIYKCMGVDPNEEMTAKKYALGILLFTVFSLVFFIAVVMLQAFLTLNPEQIQGMSWHLAFNTAASFYNQYELAGVFGRNGTFLFFADDLPYRPELFIRRGRYCGFVRSDQRIYAKRKQNGRKCLGGYHKNYAVYVARKFCRGYFIDCRRRPADF